MAIRRYLDRRYFYRCNGYKVFGLKGLDITALDPSADGASTGYTLLVSDDATGKVERVLATTLIQGGVA